MIETELMPVRFNHRPELSCFLIPGILVFTVKFDCVVSNSGMVVPYRPVYVENHEGRIEDSNKVNVQLISVFRFFSKLYVYRPNTKSVDKCYGCHRHTWMDPLLMLTPLHYFFVPVYSGAHLPPLYSPIPIHGCFHHAH